LGILYNLKNLLIVGTSGDISTGGENCNLNSNFPVLVKSFKPIYVF
jgi:hypothetical protein